MAPEERHPYTPGTTLPGSSYVLGAVLGTGGTAAVYEAEDATCGRRVVVKIVRPDVSRKGAFTAAQMQREARTLVALQAQTDHVVEVITAGITGDEERLPYYVMEQLNGQTLRAVLERRVRDRVPTALDEAISIGIDLGIALDHAHRIGVTHLDVKPENAFVHQKRDGLLIMKLLDFGISSMLGMTLGGFRGTYRYAAPEQIRGERVSAATDLYSLGLVLYEALALEKPFERRGERLTPSALAYAQCSRAPAPLAPLRPDAPDALIALVMQCLAKHPNERPPSAAFLATRLRGIREQAVGVRPAGLSYLETLTGVLSPVAGTLKMHVAEAPPASELFITAAVAAPERPPLAPGPGLTLDPLRPPSVSVATASTTRSLARAPAILALAVGLVVVGGTVGLAVSVGTSMLGSASRASARSTPSGESVAASMSAAPPAGLRSIEAPSAPPPPLPTLEPPAPQSAATAPSQAPSVRRAPSAPSPRVAPHPETRPLASAGAPTPPQGITTQKEWF